ncbi:hypothetical protein J26TS2_20040 [Shouchella clausii]|nr:hypothetical protein J26TS2_20040 [Shouchella clausii]
MCLVLLKTAVKKAKFYEAVTAAYKKLQKEIAVNAKHKEEAAKCVRVGDVAVPCWYC